MGKKIINTNIKLYRKYLFMYGITSLLFVLEYLESIEEFEECKKIINAIHEQEIRLDIKLFTKITDNNLQSCMDEYLKDNLTVDDLVEHSKYYSELIIKELINQNI